MTSTNSLSPTQQQAFDTLLSFQRLGKFFSLQDFHGRGKTTILQHLHARLGGIFLSAGDFIHLTRGRHPLSLEESFEQWLHDALEQHELVVLDDLHLITNVTSGDCGGYPRSGFLEVALERLVSQVERAGKKWVVASAGRLPRVFQERSFDTHLPNLNAEDYQAICRVYLGNQADQLDFAKIHRYASHLNAHQLRYAAVSQHEDRELDTERFIEFLRSRHLASNVDLQEVQPVRLEDLHGIGEVLQSLETNIILPLENDALAAELQLKPKRGVLLVGPPGTGKTTVGRALAHRLRSKFFLIDGTVISGTRDFYHQIYLIVEQAKCNAPSIIFIDDSDVIFESGQELGLYRYLLTILDGLESETLRQVCVMLTAMDVSHIPPALIRSGRVELWLEMRLPDVRARTAILQQHLAGLPEELTRDLNRELVVAAAEGFSGADLKRVVEDAKNLLAYDRLQQQPNAGLTAYLVRAIQGVRSNRERYAVAEEKAQRQRRTRPVYYDSPVSAGVDGFEE